MNCIVVLACCRPLIAYALTASILLLWHKVARINLTMLPKGWRGYFLVGLLIFALAYVVHAPDSDEEGDDDTRATTASSLTGLAIMITAVKTCQLCGTLCNAPHPWAEIDEDGGPWWPWLHYKRVSLTHKTPTARMCSFCRQVFKRLALFFFWFFFGLNSCKDSKRKLNGSHCSRCSTATSRNI